VNPRRRRIKRRRRRERRERAAWALDPSIYEDDFLTPTFEPDDDQDEDAMLWCITFDPTLTS
jgi:hypothetical protein